MMHVHVSAGRSGVELCNAKKAYVLEFFCLMEENFTKKKQKNIIVTFHSQLRKE